MAKSNLPTKPANTAVANYQEQLAKEAAEAASQEAAQTEFISFRGGILALPTGQVQSNEFNCIVLDSAYEHAFYGDYNDGNPEAWAFDQDNPKSPSCYAFGKIESELKPHAEGDDAAENPVHTDCATCPLNAWGSDPDGGKGKACKNIRRLALIDAGALASGNPAAINAASVMFAKLPVTSGKHFSAHVINLNNVVKRPIWSVISKMTVVRDANTQFQVKWEYVDNVPDELIVALQEKRAKMGDAVMFTYPQNSAREEQPAQPAKTAGKYTAPQKPQKARQPK